MASAAGVGADAVREIVTLLRTGPDVVILYGERLISGDRAEHAAKALLNVATPPGARRPRGRRPARGPGRRERPRPA